MMSASYRSTTVLIVVVRLDVADHDPRRRALVRIGQYGRVLGIAVARVSVDVVRLLLGALQVEDGSLDPVRYYLERANGHL